MKFVLCVASLSDVPSRFVSFAAHQCRVFFHSVFPLLYPPRLEDRKHRVCFFQRPFPNMPCQYIKICAENCDNFENSHISHISHIIFCKINIVHFCPIIGTTFSVHYPTCHAACIKICTGTFDTFGTFFQKVKNARDFGTACLHFDTFNKTQSYQKDRKCQKC